MIVGILIPDNIHLTIDCFSELVAVGARILTPNYNEPEGAGGMRSSQFKGFNKFEMVFPRFYGSDAQNGQASVRGGLPRHNLFHTGRFRELIWQQYWAHPEIYPGWALHVCPQKRSKILRAMI
ncbi:hypothetical protein D3C87_1619860 [compost metagenome]